MNDTRGSDGGREEKRLEDRLGLILVPQKYIFRSGPWSLSILSHRLVVQIQSDRAYPARFCLNVKAERLDIDTSMVRVSHVQLYLVAAPAAVRLVSDSSTIDI